MTETFVLTHNDTPPSSNKNAGVGGRGKPQAIARTKGEWQGIFAILLLQAKVPKRLVHVTATARLEFKNKGRRDSDNFIFPVSKPLGDALTKGGWLVDDDSERYHFGGVEVVKSPLVDAPPLVKGRTTVILEVEHGR